eukprot:6173651-Pleurochrysis_carterae.AAC.1
MRAKAAPCHRSMSAEAAAAEKSSKHVRRRRSPRGDSAYASASQPVSPPLPRSQLMPPRAPVPLTALVGRPAHLHPRSVPAASRSASQA